MDTQTVDIIKNPLFFISVVVLLILLFIHRRTKLKQSENKEKIGAFAVGMSPLKESFYDYLNKKYLPHWIFLGIVFFIPFIVGFVRIIQKPEDFLSILPLLFFPFILIAVWLQSWVYKDARKRKVDTTGLGTEWGLGRYLFKKKSLSIKDWIRFDLILTIIIVLILSLLFVWFNLF